MKSVAGTKWANQHIQRLRSEGRWMKSEKESESFKFGDGHELRSQYAFLSLRPPWGSSHPEDQHGD